MLLLIAPHWQLIIQVADSGPEAEAVSNFASGSGSPSKVKHSIVLAAVQSWPTAMEEGEEGQSGSEHMAHWKPMAAREISCVVPQ